MSSNRHLAPGVDTTLLKTHFTVVTDAVGALIFPANSSHCQSCALFLFLLWFHFTDYFTIGYLFVFGEFEFRNEHDCVCPLALSDALG